MQEKIQNLEKEIEIIKQRNFRVEADKAGRKVTQGGYLLLLALMSSQAFG